MLKRRAAIVFALGQFISAGAACGGHRTFTAPTPALLALVSFEITCPSSLRIGEPGLCLAYGYDKDARKILVTPTGWTSSDSTVASVNSSLNAGELTAITVGETRISAQYGTLSASAQLVVKAEDFVSVRLAGVPGSSGPAGTTLIVLGDYGVASAASGELRAEISDPNGQLMAAGPARVVPKGGGSFAIAVTFAAPAGTKVCWSASLQVGPKRLTAMATDPLLLPCFTVVQ